MATHLWQRTPPEDPGYYWWRTDLGGEIKMQIIKIDYIHSGPRPAIGYMLFEDSWRSIDNIKKDMADHPKRIYCWKKIDLTEDEQNGILAFVINE